MLQHTRNISARAWWDHAACCVLQEALDATGIPYFLASGAQERPAVPAVQAEPGRVRVGHTPPSSAIVLVPCIVAAVLFAAVVLALAVQYARARSCRRRSLPSTMGKSMSGTVRAVRCDCSTSAGARRAACVRLWLQGYSPQAVTAGVWRRTGQCTRGRQ